MCVQEVNPVMFSSLPVTVWIWLLVMAGKLIVHLFNLWGRRQSLEASKDFSSALCKTLTLPRELGWYAGGPIVAVIHDNGQSAVRHRRRLYMVPRVLQELGVDSWNITKDQAIAVIRTRPSRRA